MSIIRAVVNVNYSLSRINKGEIKESIKDLLSTIITLAY